MTANEITAELANYTAEGLLAKLAPNTPAGIRAVVAAYKPNRTDRKRIAVLKAKLAALAA